MNRPGRILAIDDTKASLMLLQDFLTSAGHDVRAVDSGKVGLSAALADPPELILLDIRMPEIDGFEVCRRLKADPATREIPVIFLSGATRSSERVSGLELGAVDFISKPYHRAELLARVNTHLELYRLRSHLEGKVKDRTRELEESEQRFRVLVEQAPEAIFVYDVDRDRFVEANAKALSLTGRTLEQLLTLSPEALHGAPGPEALHGEFHEHAAQALAGHERVFERLVHTPDGRSAHCEVRLVRLPSSHQHLVRASYVDVSERKRAEAEQARLEATLRHAQKMQMVGQLAGCIAHDFNNVLSAIFMQLSLLRLQPDIAPQELLGAVDELWGAAQRAAVFARQLLLFSTRQPMHVATTDLNVLVTDLAGFLRHLIGERASLTLELADAPLWIEADKGMIEQLLANLCVNACDAMPHGGDLKIATRAQELDSEALQGREGVSPGPYVCLRVEDSGDGMDPGLLARIFEPFFTTKAPGTGTGLGLAIVESIVSRHQGLVEVESQPGRGSTFGVFLPRATAPRDPAPVRRQNPDPARCGHERILVVEDEELVRHMAVRCLNNLGYQVAEAADGAAALSLWENEPAGFDLLFTDMVLPGGLSGLELCARLQQRDPKLKTVITSGYSAELLASSRQGSLDPVFLPKPYQISTLAQVIRAALEADPARFPQ